MTWDTSLCTETLYLVRTHGTAGFPIQCQKPDGHMSSHQFDGVTNNRNMSELLLVSMSWQSNSDAVHQRNIGHGVIRVQRPEGTNATED